MSWFTPHPDAQGQHVAKAPHTREADLIEDFEGVRPSLKLMRSDSLSRIRTHVRTDRSPYRGRRSEFISLLGNRGGERILATQPIPPVAAISELEVHAWVKGNRPGFQIMLRVRLPRSLDAAGAPLSLYLLGDRYRAVGQWQQLRVAQFETQLTHQIRAMRVEHRVPVDPTEAYVDQVAFNLYGGADENRFWLDDLEIVAGIPITKKQQIADQQVSQVSYAQQLTAPEENWVPRICTYREQHLSDIARQGFNTVWFPSEPTVKQLESAAKEQLRVLCPPPADRNQLQTQKGIAGWVVESDTSDAAKLALEKNDPLQRPVFTAADLEAPFHPLRRNRWVRSITEKENRWIPIRNRLRATAFQGYTGFAFDPNDLSTNDSLYHQSIAELFNLELSILTPWILRHDAVERPSKHNGDDGFRTDGMFSHHSGLIWFRPTGTKTNREIDISDALYREAYFVEPGSLEPARSKRIPGGVRISLNHQKPHGLLLLSNQPQVLRAHQEHLKSIGPRYNELLVKVIRHELVALDQRLSEKIADQSYVAHLRTELHALHSRIAPLLDSPESRVNYRQLDHLLGQIERVQRLNDVRF